MNYVKMKRKFAIRRIVKMLILASAIAATGMTCRHQKRTSIDETERVRAVALQQAEQVVEPTPLVIETTTPEGGTTSITTAPQSTTTYSLSDNTTASSEASVREWVSWQVGVPWSLCFAAAIFAYIFWARATAMGNIVDTTLSYVGDQLARTDDPRQREAWYGARNKLDRK